MMVGKEDVYHFELPKFLTSFKGKDRKPKSVKTDGFGFWLVLFIFSLAVVGPLFSLFIIFKYVELFNSFLIFELLVGISLFILAVVFLTSRKSYAVEFTKIVLVVYLASFVSLLITSKSWVVALFVLVSVVWLCYLYLSKRVKQVYGGLVEKSKGFQVWTILGLVYCLYPIFGIIFAVVSLSNIFNNRKLRGLVLSLIALVLSILFFCLKYLITYLDSGGFL